MFEMTLKQATSPAGMESKPKKPFTPKGGKKFPQKGKGEPTQCLSVWSAISTSRSASDLNSLDRWRCFLSDSMGTKLGGKPGSKPGGKKPFKAQQRVNKSGAAADGGSKQHKSAFFKADKGSRKRKFDGGGMKN